MLSCLCHCCRWCFLPLALLPGDGHWVTYYEKSTVCWKSPTKIGKNSLIRHISWLLVTRPKLFTIFCVNTPFLILSHPLIFWIIKHESLGGWPEEQYLIPCTVLQIILLHRSQTPPASLVYCPHFLLESCNEPVTSKTCISHFCSFCYMWWKLLKSLTASIT